MSTLLVTSTDAGIGKTAIALALAAEARDRDREVGYMKPMGTRLRSATGKTRDEDPLLARALLDLDAEMHEMEPVVYSPTFVQEVMRGREDPEEVRSRVVDSFETLAADRDLMVVEGSDGLATGSAIDLTDVDLAAAIDAEVLLVAGYEEVGDVDEVLAAAGSIGDRLAGVVFNRVTDASIDELTEDVVPFLESRGVPVFGLVPRDEELASVPVADLAESLGAEVLSGDATLDDRVERFTVGAMGSDSALGQFRRTRNAVMIAGGDRAEIQAAALEAPGVEALLLTGGFRPPESVLGRAREEGVPVLLVQSDTRTTVDRVEGVLHSGRTRTERTVERARELLAESVDVDRLLPPAE
ncbi:phosphotransacetylase family protein [Halomicrobium urmianum]|uniref:phosphotransacetylase family protein n=1 Tax=Halomicrobium urmianum TaxID=1586233 RepID=UPI001CDA4C48|nr:phosphotransacetylase family protein [Halomicrobium urmianum]